MIRLIIVSCPKPFIEPFTDIQQNAIKSWKELNHPEFEVSITLIGDEEGVQENANMFECEWIQDVQKNEYGTPLVNNIFYKLKKKGLELEKKYPRDTVVCCYINTDIIVFNTMLTNIKAFLDHKHKGYFPIQDTKTWLLIGNRWDTNNVRKLEQYTDPQNNNEWSPKLIEYAKQTGITHGCWGIDYFIFNPTAFEYIYPFALGKFVWDRWLVGNVFRRDSLTIDISQTNFVIHQNGPWYQYSTGGKTQNRAQLFETVEVKINQSFDYYEKDICSGTRWETEYVNNDIKFIKKHSIPRYN